MGSTSHDGTLACITVFWTSSVFPVQNNSRTELPRAIIDNGYCVAICLWLQAAILIARFADDFSSLWTSCISIFASSVRQFQQSSRMLSNLFQGCVKLTDRKLIRTAIVILSILQIPLAWTIKTRTQDIRI
ncbi:hypothetical protein R3P38DRAFT_1706375 [Favolaschia claudopus]|uniref:Uncharacterized protein n=1 Tax=Favolaschia claudopus TaxID=2862362 RepID=A0AAW0AC86_9AGAR